MTSDRKHTKLTSQEQYNLYAAAYGAKKAGKPKPDYVPSSLWDISLDVLKMHINEWNAKHKRKGSTLATR